MESRKPIPSVMARLMGFDELLPQQSSQKRPRVLSENYLQKVASIGVREKRFERHSSRLTVEEKKEFKDSFQALDTSATGKRHLLQIKNRELNSSSTEAKMSFRGKDLLGKKRISVDRELHGVRKVSSSITNGFIKDLNVLSLHDLPTHLQLGKSTVFKSLHAETTRFEVFGCDNFAKECKMVASSLTNVSNRNHFNLLHSAKEAKQQIFQRWKTTKSFQPGEMLAMPDSEMRAVNYKPDKCGLRSKVSPSGADRDCRIPLGMRCLDGDVKNIPPSSLLMNLNTAGSCSTRARHNSLRQGAPVISQKSIIVARKKSMKQDSSQIHSPRCRSSSSSSKPQPIPYLDSECDNSSESKYCIQNEIENKLDDMHSSAQISAAFKLSKQNMETFQDPWGTKGELKIEDRVGYCPKTSLCSGPAANGVVDEVENNKTKFLQSLLPYLEVQQLESTKDEDPFFPLQDASILQEISNGISKGSLSSYCSSIDSETDPESQMCLEDARPSPNSVLEPLHRKDISWTSDYFQSSSVLDGLNVELETLKSETSDTYSEGSGMVSSDEDTGEGSVGDPETNEDMMRLSKVEDSRDFFYVVDVLNEAGIHTNNLTSFVDALPANKYPIDSSVFENLEKKYGEQMSWKRSERKLLFDRLNLGLVEMLQPSIGVLTWTKPVARRFNVGRGQETIEEELWMYLVSREKEASKESEKFFGKDDRWLELADDIQMIGIETENFLVDELVTDMLA